MRGREEGGSRGAHAPLHRSHRCSDRSKTRSLQRRSGAEHVALLLLQLVVLEDHARARARRLRSRLLRLDGLNEVLFLFTTCLR